MRFKEYIAELFEPVKVSLDAATEQGDDHVYIPFSVGDHDFVMNFDSDLDDDEDNWQATYHFGDSSVAFSDRYKVQNFGDGTQYKILATALGYVLAFLENRQPHELIFTAHKPKSDGKSSYTRSTVYAKMLSRSKQKLSDLGYTYDINDADQVETLFIIKRKES